MKILYVNAIMAEPAGRIFAKGVEQGLALSRVASSGKNVELIPFDVFYGRRVSPKLMGAFARHHEVDGVILSGSEKNTTDPDDPWIQEYLIGLRDLLEIGNNHEDWSGPLFPILGICFGHQAMACAFGGETSRFSRKADNVRVRALAQAHSHPVFRDLLQNAAGNELDVMVTHSDHVVRAPRGFHTTFTSDYCTIQGMAHDQWPIMTLQSHPEIISELKLEPTEAEDWNHVDLARMDDHHGAKILGNFADWIFTR